MDDESLDLLFCGDLANLMPLPKRVVRLFVSSTFTDMTLERNSLMERVYPRLKKYCREKHGLDFQVVDMRWGVRDEATDDHQTVELCSREIANCQRISLGPNFVALIGDKYGFRPLPSRIRSTEYRAVRRSLIELDFNTDFLDTWYREDLNAVPSEYVLQPISSILKNFTNKSEPELQAIDQRIWQAIHERLHDLLRLGSARLVEQGRMGQLEQQMRYCMSVTEREVIEGCLDIVEAKRRCLVYSRTLQGLGECAHTCLDQLAGSLLQKLDSSDPGKKLDSSPQKATKRDSVLRKASLKIGNDTISLATCTAQSASERRLERTRRLIGRYVDLVSKNNRWQLDTEAQGALAELKNVKLANKFPKQARNLTKFEVIWNEQQEGMSLKCDEHKVYLNQLNEHLYANLSRMIRGAVKQEQSKLSTGGLIGEILQHSHYALQVGQSLHGRARELDQVRSYVVRPSGDEFSLEGGRRLPMFIYGVGGSGKTSLLARVAMLAQEWISHGAAGKQDMNRPKDSIRRDSSHTPGLANNQQSNQTVAWNRRPCIILRFCCTTPKSSSMIGVLTSVCMQLQFNFYQFGPLNALVDHRDVTGSATTSAHGAEIHQLAYRTIPEDFVRLVFTFRQLLDNCSHQLHRNRLFVIILDSIERLASSPEHSLEERYSWLTSIVSLPPNVRLIVSCSSEPSNCSALHDFSYLKRHFLLAYFEQSRIERSATNGNALLIATEAQETCHDERPDARVENSQDDRYVKLKRLIIPAVRLLRSSRSHLLCDEKSQISSRLWPSEFLASGPANSSTQESPSPKSSAWPAKHFRAQAKGSCNEAKPQSTDSRLAAGSSRWPALGMLHVRPLGKALARNLLGHWLSNLGRNLTTQQWSLVERSFAHCSRPIFAKLTLGEVAVWKSYSPNCDSTGGLTFGSSESNDLLMYPEQISQNRNETDPGCALARYVCKQQAERSHLASQMITQRGLFEWHLLLMEQQWLHYIEHRQQNETRSVESKQNDGQVKSVVVKVGANMGHTLGGQLTGARVQSGTGTIMAASGLAAGGTVSSPAGLCRLSESIDEAICQLFARIELQHGYLLTKHSLSYITAARNGIGENELEDILSLDDVVLDDVFQYHLPPIRRIPPLLWTRIRNDLPGYLSERDVDGIVLNWHHNQFKEVTRRRYLTDPRQLVYIHSTMADYFLGKWADKPKPFRCTKQQIQMAVEQLDLSIQSSLRDSQNSGAQRSSLSGMSVAGNRLGGSRGSALRSGASISVRNRLRSSDQHEQRFQWMQAKADRRVPQQPLFYLISVSSPRSPGFRSKHSAAQRGRSSEINQAEDCTDQRDHSIDETEIRRRRYNLRKLTELPYHLMHARRFLDLATNVLFNYKWLYSTIDALGLQTLFADFEETLVCLEMAMEANTSREKTTHSSNVNASSETASKDVLRPQSMGTTEEELDANDSELLRSIHEQLVLLMSTLRLSSSCIHLDKQMLAPQLIGRLVSIVREQQQEEMQNPQTTPHQKCYSKSNLDFLGQLVKQCDEEGSSDCALLPIEHCLQSANGLQLSSLEGHSFAVTSMAISGDQRYLLAASNKFIMWDIATGEVARTVDPSLNGSIILQLKMALSGELAIAYTSDNLLLALDVPTQQFAKYEATRTICGLQLLDTQKASRFLAWTKTGWMVFKVVINELDWRSPKSSEADQGGPLTVELEYFIDLMEEVNIVGQVISVSMLPNTSTGSWADLAFAIVQNHETNMLQLLTIELILSLESKSCQSTYIWPITIQGTSISLTKMATQVVYSSAEGEIYIARRRTSTWSRPKLIRPLVRPSSNLTDHPKSPGGSLVDRRISDKRQMILALDTDCLESQSNSDRSSHIPVRSVDVSDQVELAEFEQEVDVATRAEDENEIGECQVFVKPQQQSVQSLVSTSESISFVIMFMLDRIIVLGSEQRLRVERCLLLPRDVRCVKLEPNRCQLSSVMIRTSSGEHNLVVAAIKQLLVYSYDKEQLLRSIDAHSSRITGLAPITFHSDLRIASSANGQDHLTAGYRGRKAQSSFLATCSLDTSVKIWNLANVEKKIQSIACLNHPIDSICLAASDKFPFIVCLARGEPTIWNWQTLKFICRVDICPNVTHSDVDPTNMDTKLDAKNQPDSKKITKCIFSEDGRLLVLATLQSIHLMSVSLPMLKDNSELSNIAQSGCMKPINDLWLNDDKILAKFKLIAKDSRLLVVSYDKSMSDCNGNDLSPNECSSTSSRQLDQCGNGASRLVISCHSLPDLVRLYSIECPVYPLSQPNGWHQANLEQQTKQKVDDTKGGQMANQSQGANQRQHMKKYQMPVITRNQQHIVVVVRDHNEHHEQQDRKLDREATKQRTRSSSMMYKKDLQALGGQYAQSGFNQTDENCCKQVALNIYATRDGQFVRTINLNRVNLADGRAVSQLHQAEPATKQASGQFHGNQLCRLRKLDEISNNSYPLQQDNIETRSYVKLNSGGSEPMQVSIRGDQFTRLKSIRYLDRQSIVGLIDESGRGPSFLLDITSGQLIARSSLWNGIVSTDGRYGLSWMLKSAASSASACLVSDLSKPGPSSRTKLGDVMLDSQPVNQHKADGDAFGGLKLLEMRHCKPIKSLLSLDELKYVSRGELQGVESGRKMICGFTRPNDLYVYYHDARLKRLLLIRVRDSKLIANYRLQSAATIIKCSSDGLALICCLADGTLVSLAIVDPQTSDTLTRLAAYPSRQNTSIGPS